MERNLSNVNLLIGRTDRSKRIHVPLAQCAVQAAPLCPSITMTAYQRCSKRSSERVLHRLCAGESWFDTTRAERGQTWRLAL